MLEGDDFKLWFNQCYWDFKVLLLKFHLLHIVVLFVLYWNLIRPHVDRRIGVTAAEGE